MTPDELKTKVEELEVLLKTGNDHALAETQARELLVDDALANVPELHCRTLLALSESLWRRGRIHESLPAAEETVAFSYQGENKELQAKVLSNIGIVYKGLSEHNLALEYYNAALLLNEELGNQIGVASIMGNIGLVYHDLSDYKTALQYYSRALALNEELGNNVGVAACSGNIGNVYAHLSDYGKALEYYSHALTLYEELGNKSGMANNTGNIGNVYVHLSDYGKALEYYSRALALDEELANRSGIAIWTGNIGSIYQNLLDYGQALQYINRALAVNEELGNKDGVANNTGNIGSVYHALSNHDKALEYMNRALMLYEELGNKSGIARFTGNIGSVYFSLLDYEKALKYMSHALKLNEELGNKVGMAICIGNIGNIYAKEKLILYNPFTAERYLLQALNILKELGRKKEQYEFHQSLSLLYKQQQRTAEALNHFEQYHDLEKQVQSEDAKKHVEKLNYERKHAEHEKQIAIERARAEAVEQVLQNTLPPIIAERLINKENFIADYYSSVSVLFMDLVNFTRIASIVPPKHLIYLLNSIFRAADNVMTSHGLEKIKTIGDAYMAVAGAPEEQSDHAIRAANASIELLDKMNSLRIIIPQELGETTWIESIGEIGVRIGVHSGEAIGGVIGDKKFSFDLWGDAVNTASRMESHGEAGKIHVSEEFVRELGMRNEKLGMKDKELTGDNSQFIFVPRGEMEIKGKGKMRTYFLEKL
ncbi:MAG: tetratricopeptide repeat protein [Candidatus Kapabacteria bacterium]|nr:tetratricopeptide repeat protein [Candidatus Kapabacteria bacterium]